MAADTVKSRIRDWLVKLFIRAIESVSKEEDRADVLNWLAVSRDVLASDNTTMEKIKELHSLIDTRKTIKTISASIVESVKNYKNSELSLPIKLAIPAILLAMPFIGGQGVGVAALGGAVGLPALLLVFLGTAGITSVLESVTRSKQPIAGLDEVVDVILNDETSRQIGAALRKAMKNQPKCPQHFHMPDDDADRRESLLSMDPFEFEQHVMSFFSADGLTAWVTRKSNDMGVDGFAKHPDGLIVVQCKRYAADNTIGRPSVQQFKGVIEENGAFLGYFVTTSSFTKEAAESAALSEKLILVDMVELLNWHKTPPNFHKQEAATVSP